MRLAETVTFGGSDLDRAAAWRGDAVRIEAFWAEGRVVPLWRGKVLLRSGDEAGLGWLSPTHPVLADAGLRVFLGLQAGRPLFAVDLSGWTPPADEAAVQPGFFDPSEQRHPALGADHAFVELRGVMTRLSPLDAECAATARALLQWHSTHGFCAVCGAATTVAMAGWQRGCGACGASHFPRTDPVVIMLVTRGNRLLLGRSPGWPEGMYSLIAGFVEPGETLEAAVRREVVEETGIRTGPVRYLASQPWPFPASLMFGCQTEALDEEIQVDPVEIEDALWVTREEMVRIMAGGHERIKSPRKGAIAHFLIANWLADRLE